MQAVKAYVDEMERQARLTHVSRIIQVLSTSGNLSTGKEKTTQVITPSKNYHKVRRFSLVLLREMKLPSSPEKSED